MKPNRTHAALLLALLLGGCASGWIEQEDVGDAARDAVRAQSLNPPSHPAAQGLDGVAARASVDNYQKAATAPRIDLGSGSSTTSSSSTVLTIGTGTQP